MTLRDEIDAMTDFRTVYEPFRKLTGVGPYRNNCRLLSYLLHLHMETGTEWVELDPEAFHVVNMSPFGLKTSRNALLKTAYVKSDDGRLSVQIPALMKDVQGVHDTWERQDENP